MRCSIALLTFASTIIASSEASTTSSPNAKTRELTTYTAIDGQSPELVEYSPWTDDVLEEDVSTTLSASVVDDNIKRVSFKFKYPDGTTSDFVAGTRSGKNGDMTTWTHSVDTTSQWGVHGYKIRMVDRDSQTVTSSGWIEFLVAGTEAELVDAAREMIASLCDDAWPTTNLCAKFVRHGFHDCVGGCDGCIDMSNGDNAGLDVTIAALEPVVEMFEHYGMTRADIWVLSALEASVWSQDSSDLNEVESGTASYPFTMNWIGRPNCEDLYEPSDCVDGDCSAERGPDRELPGPDLNTHELLDYFQTNFDFSARDTVAIMGAHKLGELARENSGFDGSVGWTANNQLLTNGYYGQLIGGESAEDDFEDLMDAGAWEMDFVDNTGEGYATSDRWQWERGIDEAKMFVMLNSDIAIVRDLSGFIADDGEVSECQFKCTQCDPVPRCPYAEETFDIAVEYRFDNDSFMTDFEDAFTRMLEWGVYDTSAGCLSPPCTLASVARRNLRSDKSQS